MHSVFSKDFLILYSHEWIIIAELLAHDFWSSDSEQLWPEIIGFVYEDTTQQ